MHGDLEAAVTMLAADNARMINILIAAEKLEKAAQAVIDQGAVDECVFDRLEEAIEKYKQVRSGN